MPKKRPRPKRVYFTEQERPNRWYVYYVTLGTMTKTLFDITVTEALAKQAIKDHKRNRHPTQH